MQRKVGSTRTLFAFAIVTATVASPAEAKTFAEMFPGVELKTEAQRKAVEGMDFQQGVVKLGAGGVKFDVPPKFYFLGPADARKVLLEIWGNPPANGQDVLGMVMPAIKMPVEDTWGAVVRFDADGYVSDEEANKIDYADLLKTMQQQIEDANDARVKAGFGNLKLVGWASQPYYDDKAKKLHWAKELEFNGRSDHTLNYDVRALGRSGVLKMNFVARMDELPVIRGAIPDVMEMVQFEQGSRYSDFIPGADKVAAYGIGGLIAGKLAAKVGLLAGLLLFLKKGWIVVALMLGGIGKVVGRWFKK